jgi:hypothetical protein
LAVADAPGVGEADVPVHATTSIRTTAIAPVVQIRLTIDSSSSVLFAMTG